MTESRISLYLALVHHPVLNRKGEIISSAITNLDLHDMGRLACTYGIPACYIVTPLLDQQALAHRLIQHWCDGIGKVLHPDRERALRRLCIVDDVAAVIRDIQEQWGRRPVVWATTAHERSDAITARRARKFLATGEVPCLLLLGTGWGLAPMALADVDGVVKGICGTNGYNHLSVRCAAAILVDRLLARGEDDRGLEI